MVKHNKPDNNVQFIFLDSISVVYYDREQALYLDMSDPDGKTLYGKGFRALLNQYKNILW